MIDLDHDMSGLRNEDRSPISTQISVSIPNPAFSSANDLGMTNGFGSLRDSNAVWTPGMIQEDYLFQQADTSHDIHEVAFESSNLSKDLDICGGPPWH